MKNLFFIVVAYDIKSNKRRNKISNILLDYGERVQYSVFECLVSEMHLEMMKNRLEDVMEEEDKVYFYPLCKACREKIVIYGGEEREKSNEVVCYIV